MAKALQLDAEILNTAPPVPSAALTRAPIEEPSSPPTGKREIPKVGQVPLQVRWPKNEVKAAKLASVELDFPTVSEFMLACFHAFMDARKQM